MTVFLLTDKIAFPPPHLASGEGLLAIGGDLSRERLLLAYRMGIFPWFSDDEPILWWSPDPRLVLYPREIRISKTLKKIIRKGVFTVTVDSAFVRVINQCAQIRLENNQGTWIVEDMIDVYCKLHESGFAHSVEAWRQGELAGGLYGVSLGRCFFGESMFSRERDTSKIGLVYLVQALLGWHFRLIDCQLNSAHLASLGAEEISRPRFIELLNRYCTMPGKTGNWME